MFKKILVATLAIAGIGILAYGAVNRTQAKNETAASSGRGRGASESLAISGLNENQGSGQRGGGWGGNAQAANLAVDVNNDVMTGTLPNGRGNGGSGNGGSGGWESGYLAPTFQDALTSTDMAALQYMYEEEKLARDVYAAMYEIYGQRVFENIGQSEQTHMDAVKQLLDGYGITYPAALPAGQFDNADLQKLYDDLIAQGKQSLADALKVGATVEEVDILDLEKRLASTQSADVQSVFENLKSGSYNHLNAFAGTLARTSGESYVPRYLSQEAYDAILSGGSGSRGNGGGGGYRGGRSL